MWNRLFCCWLEIRGGYILVYYISNVVFVIFKNWFLIFEDMSALFNFHSLLTVVLLLICTCAYIRSIFPALLDKNKSGFLGLFWKCARIGERKSPYISLFCLAMAASVLFW